MRSIDQEYRQIQTGLQDRIAKLQAKKAGKAFERDETDVWKYEPVSPEEFIKSPHFLNEATGRIWPCIIDDMNVIFSGPDKFGRPSFFPACQVFLDDEGIGSGKSTKIAIFNAYMCYLLLCLRDPLAYFGLFDSSILLMNVAPTENKAKEIVFVKTQNIIAKCKWFSETNNSPEARLRSKMKFYRHLNTEGLTDAELHHLDMLEQKGQAEIMPTIIIAPGNSSVSAPTGADLFFGVIDEACSDNGFETASVDTAGTIYDNMNERRLSRFMESGIVCCISSAGSEDRWMEKKITEIEAYRVRNDIPPEQKIVKYKELSWYVIRRPSYDANPKYQRYFRTGQVFTYNNVRTAEDGTQIEDKLTIPNMFREKFENDPHTSLKNICSLPTSSVYKYITNWNGILKRINMEREDPCPDPGEDEPLTVEMVKERLLSNPEFMGDTNLWYYCHVDLATGGTTTSGKDGAGLCVGHRGGNAVRGEGSAKPVDVATVVIDLAIRLKTHGRTVKAGENEIRSSEMEIQLSEVRDFLVWLHKEKGFRFSKITFDGWQSKDSIQILTDMGYLCENDSVTNDSFDTMKELWYDDRLDILHDTHALWELRKLERKANGKIEKSVGASDDEIECIAKVCEHCVEGELPEIKKARAKGIASSGLGGKPSLPNMGAVRQSAMSKSTHLQPMAMPKIPGMPRMPHTRRK